MRDTRKSLNPFFIRAWVHRDNDRGAVVASLVSIPFSSGHGCTRKKKGGMK